MHLIQQTRYKKSLAVMLSAILCKIDQQAIVLPLGFSCLAKHGVKLKCPLASPLVPAPLWLKWLHRVQEMFAI